MNAPMSEVVATYCARGWAIAAIPPGTKGPRTPGWNKPGGYVTDPEHARVLWSKKPGWGVGLVHGPSGTCALDIDDVEATRHVFAELGWDYDTLLDGAPRLRGNPERDKALFRVPKGVELALHKLTWPPRPETPEGKPATLFELRAGPVQDVLPPSGHPGTHRPYEWTRKPEGALPELPASLLDLWQHWEEAEPVLKALCPWAPPPERSALEVLVEQEDRRRRQEAGGGGGDVIGAFNRAHTVEELLEAHGYVRRGGPGRYLSPTSSSGLPGVRILDSGKVYSDHASDPLAQVGDDGRHHAHTAFSIYCHLDHGGDVHAAVRAAAAELGIEASSGTSDPPPEPWPDPKTLPPPLAPVSPFDYDLLPEALRPWVRDVAERMQCPPEFPAAAAVVVLSALLGRRCAIRPKEHDDWTVVPNLWGAIVGRPSLLKSPALKEAMAPLYRWEAEAKGKHDKQRTRYEEEKAAAETEASAAKSVLRSLAKKELTPPEDTPTVKQEDTEKEKQEREKHITKLKEKASYLPSPPVRRRYVTSDTTVEKLGELLQANPNGILIFRDELVGWLRTLDKQGHENDRSFYLEAWNGDSRFTYDRIGRGTVDIEAACVSILGGIQPGPLSSYIKATKTGGDGDDGLLQRFQMVVWPDMRGEWRNIDRPPDTAAKGAFFAACDRVADPTYGPAVAWGSEGGEGVTIPFLQFDEVAQAQFTAWRTTLERRLREDDLPAILEAHLGKYRSLVPSLALIFHLADNGTGPVPLAQLVRAIAWAEFLEKHARRIYGSEVAPEIEGAHNLAKHLLAGDLWGEGDPKDRFTLTKLYRHHWSHLATPDEAAAAVEVLVERGWLEELPVPYTKGRPPSPTYLVNPKLKKNPPTSLEPSAESAERTAEESSCTLCTPSPGGEEKKNGTGATAPALSFPPPPDAAPFVEPTDYEAEERRAIQEEGRGVSDLF